MSTHRFRFEVDEYMVIFVNRVRIGVRFPAASLEIFPAYQTAVDIDICKGNRADFFKVKIQHRTLDL